MRQFIFNSKNLLIVVYLAVAFLGGFVFGLRMGYIDGSQTTTEIRNQMLDIKPYDASLQIKDLGYKDISPSGCTITFNTDQKPYGTIYLDDVKNLTCEWAIYPSDIFTITPVKIQLLGDCLFAVDIETYPEGGTLMFRILEGSLEDNHGSLWFYINLPRSDSPDAILPPPYMPSMK